MQAPVPTSATPAASPSAAASAAPTATTTEVIHRPDPGLGRGVWEASPAFFWLVLAGAALACSTYVLVARAKARRRATVSTKDPGQLR